MEYRKAVPLSTAEYWWVDLGRLNSLNEGGSWPFPTREAAYRFAGAHKALAAEEGTDREVTVREPDGTVFPLELGKVTDPETGKVLSLFGEITS
ncbi:hypothetical protein M045_gp67 [Mycobacterium phage HINdeR]|uniref:Uncharacterized protein n=1 Tax=Mycobacterium phage HINdeR TaxID=1327770 RepID=R4JP39_9CAUD|nr:hypothetical protein M045_gp67 [Mycobacterium phage HINdeR]AGK87546.1 hypothetical protein PBI_HINDER_67 [Mycobacterium phage HINdeR]